jgi:hypothetical protein
MKKYQIKEIIDHYLVSGLKSTVENCNISTSQIYRILKENGIKPHVKINNIDKELKKSKAIELYKEGHTKKNISEILNLSYDWLLDMFKKEGLIEKVVKQIDYNPFENYLNPHIQYWLGLLATDGSISDNRLSLFQCIKHKDIILKFQSFLGDVRLREVTHKKKNGNFQAIGIQFRNKKVCQYLTDIIGITSNKTFTLKIKIPITFDFLRGAIDGDGSIEANYDRIRLCSASKEFIDQISTLLSNFNIIHGIYFRKTKNGIYEIQVNEHFSVNKLLNFLYYDGCTYLECKYHNAQCIRNNMQKRFKFRELSSENPERNLQDEIE